jgi:hypothetical protein
MYRSIGFNSRFSIFELRNLCEIAEINPDGTKRPVRRNYQVNVPTKGSSYLQASSVAGRPTPHAELQGTSTR